LLALFISLLFHIPLLLVRFDFRVKKIKTENVVVVNFSETGTVAEKEVAHERSSEKNREVEHKDEKKKEREKERKREKEKKSVEIQRTGKFKRKVVGKKKIEERKKEISRVVEKEEENLQKVEQNTESNIQPEENVGKEKMKTERQTLEKEKSNVEDGNVVEKSVSEGEAEKGKTVVSTNKNEFDRESYVSLIIQEIERKKFYPPLARRFGIEGKVVVRIVVDREGKLKEVSVVKSSGNKILDRAASKLMKKCDFPPLPPEYQKEVFDVEVPIRYELK